MLIVPSGGTALQAVIHGPFDERASIDVLDNPNSTDPAKVAKLADDGRVPPFTPPQIVRLVEYATGHGYRLVRFQLRDSAYNLLPPHVQDELSPLLVEAYGEGGLYGLQIALKEHPGVYLNGAEFYRHPGVKIEVRRRGVIFATDREESEHFLRAAWPDLLGA